MMNGSTTPQVKTQHWRDSNNIPPMTAPLKELAPSLADLAAKKAGVKKGQKINKTPLAESDKVDPNGRQWLMALTKIFKYGTEAADALGMSSTAFNSMLNGEYPIRKSISLAAQYLLDKHTKPETPVSVTQQTVAVVVVPKEQGEVLRNAVLGVGGTFSPLSFEGEGVKL